MIESTHQDVYLRRVRRRSKPTVVNMRGRSIMAVLPCETCWECTRHTYSYHERAMGRKHRTFAYLVIYSCDVCDTGRVWGCDDVEAVQKSVVYAA